MRIGWRTFCSGQKGQRTGRFSTISTICPGTWSRRRSLFQRKKAACFSAARPYSYDEDGRQTGILFDSGKWTLAEDGTERRLEEAETGKTLHLSFSYDARGRLVQAEDGNGACIWYEYDVRGNKTKEEQVISEDVTKTICFRYDRAGRLSEKKELIAGWAGEGFEKSVRAAVTIYKSGAENFYTKDDIIKMLDKNHTIR